MCGGLACQLADMRKSKGCGHSKTEGMVQDNVILEQGVVPYENYYIDNVADDNDCQDRMDLKRQKVGLDHWTVKMGKRGTTGNHT